MSENINQLVEKISALTLMETATLVKALEEKLGVSAAAPVAMAAPAAVAAAAVEEKTSFDVILVSAGESKINVIKEIRALTGLGLVESKAMAEAANSAVLKDVKKEEAEEAKKKLEAAGAKVEIK